MSGFTIFYKGGSELSTTIPPVEDYSLYTRPAVRRIEHTRLVANLQAVGAMAHCVISNYSDVATGIHIQCDRDQRLRHIS